MSPTTNPLEEAYRLYARIDEMKEEIGRLEVQAMEYLMVAEENGTTEAGGYRLVQEIVKKRTVNVQLLREFYPDRYAEIVSAPAADLVRILGKQHLVSIARATKTQEFEAIATVSVADARAALTKEQFDQVVDVMIQKKDPKVVKVVKDGETAYPLEYSLNLSVREMTALQRLLRDEGVNPSDRRAVTSWILGQCGIEAEVEGGA